MQHGSRLAAVIVGHTGLAAPCRLQNGRGRTTDGRDILSSGDLGSPLGRDATLVQFSSKICAPCRTTHAVLDSVADGTGVTHVDLDVVVHEPLTRRFNILQTPTTLILDRHGVVRARIGGAVRYADVRARIVDLTS